MVPAEQFIVCSHCGTKNRLPSLRTGRPRCGRCGKPLASAVVQSTSTASGAAPSRATHGGKVGWLTGIAALLVFGAGGVLLLKPFGEGVSGGTGGPPTVGLQSPAIDDWVTRLRSYGGRRLRRQSHKMSYAPNSKPPEPYTTTPAASRWPR
jgi:hypothetical protein